MQYLAETGEPSARARTAVVGAEHVAQRSLPLASPHQAVHLVRTQVVFDEPEPEIARVRIARAGKARCRTAQHHLARAVEAGHVRGDHVLEPWNHFHPASMRLRDDVGEHVVAAVIGRVLRRNARVAVELRMRRGVIAAAERRRVVLLPPVIRQRLVRQLASRNAAPVGERGNEQGVDRRHLLQRVEHLVGPFVDERHRADLDPDHRRVGPLPLARAGWRQAREQRSASQHRGAFKELTAIHVLPPYQLPVTSYQLPAASCQFFRVFRVIRGFLRSVFSVKSVASPFPESRLHSMTTEGLPEHVHPRRDAQARCRGRRHAAVDALRRAVGGADR